MPSNKASLPSPPPVMTWSKAAPVLIAAFLFDALRAFFTSFVFFGPAFAALYCTIKAGSYLSFLGSTGTGIAATICSGAAGAAGLGASPITFTFGLVMATAVGFLGWIVVGAVVLLFNSRLIMANPSGILWFMGGLITSETPFVGALPALTGTFYGLYKNLIKSDKEALAAYEKQAADARAKLQQQRQAQLQTAQIAQVQAMQEAANAATMYSQEDRKAA